jgi:hypothetical protein
VTPAPRGGECQCPECDLIFTSLTAFDIHRRGNICTPPDKVVDKKGNRLLFGKVRAGGRIVWSGAPRETPR